MPIKYNQALPLKYNGPFSENFFSKGVAYKVQWVMLKKKFFDFFLLFYCGDWILCIYKTQLRRNFS